MEATTVPSDSRADPRLRHRRPPGRRRCGLRILVALSGVLTACGRDEARPPPASTEHAAHTGANDPSTPGHGERKADADAGATPLQSLARRRKELDRTLWRTEMEALEHERTFVRLRDDLRSASEPYTVLRALPFDRLVLGAPGEAKLHDGEVHITPCGQPSRSLGREAWRGFLDRMRGFGFRLVQSEWHHDAFRPAADGPASSVVRMRLHVESTRLRRRVIVSGDLEVRWSDRKDSRGLHVPDTIDASGVVLIDRTGPVPFQSRLTIPAADASSAERRSLSVRRAHPLIVYDLDDDGLSEIVLGGWNRVYWNHGDGKFQWEELCRFPRRIAPAGVVADFTGDGRPDFVCVATDSFLYLYRGGEERGFRERGRRSWNGSFTNPTVLSAGDIDMDGDLDLWVAQYKSAYTAGQMPTPFHDANDGHPSFLLENDGEGRFSDVTEAAGLAAKRFRRTYSASFVDLDDDGDLDLLNVADFSGVDVFRNDGAGRFSDVTSELITERHNAGMSHSFADFDLDGQLDFCVIGMGSSTVRRLDRLGLGRPESPRTSRMRGLLTYGNRMYLRRGGRFEEPAMRDEIARTGWSWGSSAFDFDADGDSDLYIANGNISGGSARDYCSEFWRHDVYLGDSSPDAELERHFKHVLSPLIRGEVSWNGFEHNALLMNRGGAAFLDVGFLFGLAFEFDARGVVSDDLDGDGRLDLVVTEQKTTRLQNAGHVVHVYQNRLQNDNHWIGVRLKEEGGGFSPVGAKVVAKTSSGLRIATVVTGDSLRSQHASRVHFGLGKESTVEWLEVRWVNGAVRRIDRPVVDRYHPVPGRPTSG